MEMLPLDRTISSSVNEKNAATGNDRKLADASPSAESSASQNKIIISPRTKFRPNPPSR